jgi:prepilin-type N-terminal cleavage/methylation domain-containing protein
MRARGGFTLIELMVAMALTLFIMVILSQAFVASLDTFSGLKAIGDMQQNLRTAEVMLRDDLSQDHFEGKRRVSDLTIVANASELNAHHPQAGFFAVRQSSPLSAVAGAPYYNEGNDSFTVPSVRAVDHMIYMTVKRKGNRPENFFNTALQGDAGTLGTFFNVNTAYDIPSTDLPYSTQTLKYDGSTTGYFSSQWAEVLYYLVRTGSTEQPNDPTSTLGTPTYGLYRAQFVMVPDATNLTGKFANAKLDPTFIGLSCNPDGATLKFYTPADAAVIGQRVIPDLTAFDPLDPRVFKAATLVCPNVIAFNVRIISLNANLTNLTFGDLSFASTYKGVYDTAKFQVTGYPNNGLRGIQVTLRVWDNKTRQTRQATVTQDL